MCTTCYDNYICPREPACNNSCGLLANNVWTSPLLIHAQTLELQEEGENYFVLITESI
jgi:hypothetical protein